VSTNGTGEESAGAGAGNDIDSGKGIGLKEATRCFGEKYETDSKNVTSADTIFLGGGIITSVSLLSSRILNKNTLDSSRRKFV